MTHVDEAVSSTAPDDSAVADWTVLCGRRVVLDDRWISDDEERPGRESRHQGVLSSVAVGNADAIELTLTRYDGRTLLVRPVGQFTVTDADTGDVLYAPFGRTPYTLPQAFVTAVREVAPERWDELLWVMRRSVDELSPHKAQELVDLAAHIEWECTQEQDVLDDPASPAAQYADAARHVVQMWETDPFPRSQTSASTGRQ
ncbi:hypothetical protein G6045_35825 [Streptomyces sp. YC504]|uniref:Uncharacterized protein n=1 Tax=Streptomyces mesophilus TaxID=1775132 RepID=A0A6G4XWL1_9ACTN|nr:hypothetical protein [Streptomyces mesophilus]NGO80991.1 hypothetical protein [Streptomyces mesophilus]